MCHLFTGFALTVSSQLFAPAIKNAQLAERN